MATFRDYDFLVERVLQDLPNLEQTLDKLREAPVITPLLRGALCTAAENLERATAPASDVGRPRDMTDDEWDEPAIKLMRAAMETLNLQLRQRPRDVADWAYELRLAAREFRRAKLRFDAEIER